MSLFFNTFSIFSSLYNAPVNAVMWRALHQPFVIEWSSYGSGKIVIFDQHLSDIYLPYEVSELTQNYLRGSLDKGCLNLIEFKCKLPPIAYSIQ